MAKRKNAASRARKSARPNAVKDSTKELSQATRDQQSPKPPGGVTRKNNHDADAPTDPPAAPTPPYQTDRIPTPSQVREEKYVDPEMSRHTSEIDRLSEECSAIESARDRDITEHDRRLSEAKLALERARRHVAEIEKRTRMAVNQAPDDLREQWITAVRAGEAIGGEIGRLDIEIDALIQAQMFAQMQVREAVKQERMTEDGEPADGYSAREGAGRTSEQILRDDMAKLVSDLSAADVKMTRLVDRLHQSESLVSSIESECRAVAEGRAITESLSTV